MRTLFVILTILLVAATACADVIGPGRRPPTAQERQRRRELFERGRRVPVVAPAEPLREPEPSHPNLEPTDDNDGLDFLAVASIWIFALAWSERRRSVLIRRGQTAP
jgi:hypothetical protein